MAIERDQRKFFSVANVLAMIGTVVMIGAAWGERVADAADTKRRLTVVEARQAEDRVTGKEDREVIKRSVKETNDNVQLILRKLDSFEAVRQAERRRDMAQ